MLKTKIRGNIFYYDDLNPELEEVMVMIHGHPFDHTMWKYQYDTLKDYRIIAPDLRGYGKSDYLFDKIFIEEQALDIALLLDELEIEKVHLMGLSMGGQILIEFYRLFPNRVNSLIVCASSPRAETEETYKNRLALAEKIQEIGMVQYTKEDIHKYLAKKTVEEKNEVYKHLYTMMVKTKKEGAVASHKGRAERRDNYSYLDKITIPTLVIAGEEDYFFPVAEMEKIAEQIPDAKLEILEGAGHMPNMEQVDKFNLIVKEFLDKIR